MDLFLFAISFLHKYDKISIIINKISCIAKRGVHNLILCLVYFKSGSPTESSRYVIQNYCHLFKPLVFCLHRFLLEDFEQQLAGFHGTPHEDSSPEQQRWCQNSLQQ